MEETQEIVPIKILNQILFDQHVFLRFVRNPNDIIFNHINQDTLVKSLNDYFKYMIDNENTLEQAIFEKMNYINIYFNNNERYSFYDYLSQTTKLINLNSLYQILGNEKKYQEFMDFDENNFEFSKQEYLKALDQMMDFYKKNNIELNNIILINYENIKEKHKELTGENPTSLNNEEFEKELFKNVNMNNDKFTIARELYLNLAEKVVYDVNFYAEEQNIKKNSIYNIYHKKPDEITIEKNKIVCKTWAEIYCNLLKKIGLETIIEGNFHKYVVFRANDKLIKADASNSYKNDDENFSLNDISRVKVGIPTAGFNYLNKKSIKEDLEKADKKINFDHAKLNEKLNLLEQKYVTVKKESYTKFETYKEKLILMNALMSNEKLEGLEFCKYLNSIRKIMLSNEEKENSTDIYAFRKINHYNYEAIIINAYLDEDEYKYYIFDKNKGIEEVNYYELNLEILTNNIKLYKKNIEIPHQKEDFYARF